MEIVCSLDGQVWMDKLKNVLFSVSFTFIYTTVYIHDYTYQTEGRRTYARVVGVRQILFMS